MKNYIYLCPSSTNSESIVAGHHLNQVGSFCEMYRHEVDLVNRLRDGCNRVVQTIAKESTFFEKVRIDLFLFVGEEGSNCGSLLSKETVKQSASMSLLA